HRAQRDRLGPAGRWRAPAQVLQPDLRGRRGRRLPRDADRARAPVVPVAGRGALDRAAPTRGGHPPLGPGAQVLPAPARAVRAPAAEAPGAVRLGLPDDHAGPLAERLREAGDLRRGTAADPEGERGQAAGSRLTAAVRTTARRRTPRRSRARPMWTLTAWMR